VVGRDAALLYRGGGTQAVYGGLIVDEPSSAGTTRLSGNTRDETLILYSKESLDLVQRALQRRFVTTYSWNDRGPPPTGQATGAAGWLADRHGLGATVDPAPESSRWENIGPPGTHRPILFIHKGERLLIWRSSASPRKYLAST